jgi:hypothetical protein
MPLTKRTRRALAVGGVIAGVAVLAAAGVYLSLYVGLSGGPSQALKRFARRPDPAGLAPQRSEAGRRLRSSVDRLAVPLHLAPASPAWEAVTDACYAGQHNFEVKDPFAYRCTLRITRYFGADGDFRELLLGLGQQLEARGWRGGDLPRIVTDYYDRYYGPGKPKPGNLSPPGAYLVSSLPTPVPYRTDGMTLTMAYAERATTDLSSLDSLQRATDVIAGPTFYRRERFVDAGAVFRSVTAAHPYLLAIAAESHYFEK